MIIIKMQKIIGVSAIVMLLLLILFPPFLRKYANFDTMKMEAKGKNDSINVVNCKDADSEINTSYLNGKTYNIQYKIRGNYQDLHHNDENQEKDENNNLPELKENEMANILKPFAKESYDAKKDQTIYKLAITDELLKNISLNNYLLSIKDQITYYESLGYKCSSLNL